MNSQFSYELDERQIRIMMQSGETEFSESSWQRFESLSKNSVVCSKSVSFSPKINLSISRSIIVPIFFIALIGGLSVLLFSFVDFKKKEEVVKEKPLIIPEPKVEQKIAATKPAIVVKPQAANTVTINNNKPADTETKTTTPITNANVVLETKSEAKVVTETENAREIKQPVQVSQKDEKSKKETTTKKKRRKKLKAEELPTINTTPAILTTSEPELDIK